MMKPKAKRTLCISVLLAILMCAVFAFASCNNNETPSVDPNTEYTITFVTDSTSEIDPITVKHGEMAEKPDNPVKEGHVFKGWFIDLTSENSFIFDETAVTSNLTLYAKWQIRQYTITYTDNEGNAIEGLGGTADWGTKLAKPDETGLGKTGYILKWYTASGDIWDFETSKVVANTTLSYQYVSTKDTYASKDIYDDFFSSFNRGDLSPENSQEHYVNGATYYTYAGTQLQQAIVNLELSTIDYSSVTVKYRSVGYTKNAETGEYTFDPANGGTFGQVRGYIVTELGGHLQFNDKGASGYDPVNYYIQSTGTNKDLYSQETVDGWIYGTFNISALGYYRNGTTLLGFGFGFVSSSCAIEIESVVFNKVDKTAKFDVKFEDRLGNVLADTQNVLWGTTATKPEKLEDTEERTYTGEWVDDAGNVYDFANPVRAELTLYPEYSVNNKYSWTGEEIGIDFMAVQNQDRTLPADEFAKDGNTVFTFNNRAGNSIKLVSTDTLNLPIGDYRYLTAKFRILNKNDVYEPSAVMDIVRIYVMTELGGNAFNNAGESKESYYYSYDSIDFKQVSTPVDVTAKLEGGWYVVTVDMNAFPFYADGTTLKGFAIGVRIGDSNGLEFTEISFSKELANIESYTVNFVDKNGNAITAIENQTVSYGKVAVMPDSSLVTLEQGESFAYWADENGVEYNFGTAVTANVTLKAVITNVWTGYDYTFKGQDVVENFIAGPERYGNKKDNYVTLSTENNIDANGDAYVDFSQISGATNMCLTVLDAGIRVHEGSKLVITYTSNKYPTYTVNRINLNIAFRGQDPLTQINSATTTTYFQWKNIAYGTTTGTCGDETSSNVNDEGCISFVVAEDGTVTVTFDLYAMQQACVALGLSSATVDLNYIDAFTFMIVETNSGTSPQKSGATLTYKSFEFIDVQLDKEPKYTLNGKQIAENFTASYERYGNTVNSQKELTLDENGNATFDYSVFAKPNMAITTLNAGIKVVEGTKLVITYKSSTYSTYTVNRLNLCIAFKGQDPATQIIGDQGTYFQYKNIEYGTTEGSSESAYVKFVVAEDGTVTVTYDLYAISQACASMASDTVDVTYIDAYTFMIVETNSGTGTATSNATLTYESIEIVIIADETTEEDTTEEGTTDDGSSANA